ncbi:hypothetical protein GCM10022393_24260 [Aquimarina addita]|uniref:Uncharacterized protein n=1 Tax=Aquimarina addita TaxID=870485 RepID=A0ABP6UN66_9FLAO
MIGIGFSIFSRATVDIPITLQTKQTIFKAGDNIVLRFTTNEQAVRLYCHSSYGVSILDANKDGKDVIFTIPDHFTSKKGVLNYKLVHTTKVVFEGVITIVANSETTTQLETYIGPPDITAGGKNHTMMVVIPTDSYDNPVEDSTSIKMKHQFLDTEKETIQFSKDFIGWERIFSFERSGRILASNEVNGTASKEFAIEVFSANAVDFEINYQRKHGYADGNQITTFTTSVIKDMYENIISDGTLVTFFVRNAKGMILKTNGTTVNGIAKGKLLHPDHMDQWEVKAYITGIAESTTLSLIYEQSTADFDVNFQNKNRRIRVGPLQSFMGQRMPDGAVITCLIYREGKYLETKTKTSSNGFVDFIVDEGFYPAGSYNFKIEGLGIHKEFKDVVL